MMRGVFGQGKGFGNEAGKGVVPVYGTACEELTTYETREVVAVPNSRSMGGV
jgi:hypothetical protein